MERSLIEAHLAQAEKHVAQGERHIAEQRKRIARLADHGHDTNAAKDLLHGFERTQASHLADRDRLREELTRAT